MDDFSLTRSEREVLDLLTSEYLSPKQIQIRRNCTRQAVSKIISSLKRKGAYNLGLQKVDNSKGSQQPPNQIRLHAHQFRVKIISKDHRYKKLLEKTNQITIDGNTIDLHEGSIYVSFNQSFYGDTISHAFHKSGQYWRRFVARMEHETNCILSKPRSQNIKLCRIHIAETNNELAIEIDNTGDRWFKVYADDDGALRFLIDNSFNLHEFEAVRARTARPDMEKIGRVFNDLADKPHLLPSETKVMIDKLVVSSYNILEAQKTQFSVLERVNEAILASNKNVAWLNENLETHLPIYKDVGEKAGKMLKHEQFMKKAMKELKSMVSQKKLGEYL